MVPAASYETLQLVAPDNFWKPYTVPQPGAPDSPEAVVDSPDAAKNP